MAGGPGSYVLGEEEKKELLDVIENGALFRYGTPGVDGFQAKVATFEKEMAERLAARGVSAEVVKLSRIAPLDIGPVRASVEKTGALLTAEDGCRAGGVGERLLAALALEGKAPRRVRLLDLGDGILTHGAPDALRKLAGLDGESIARAAEELIHG